ncbi:MAG: hypothetical protein FVQ84_08425 [Planctomycetes bacterium]|nr:hypothetical protein [Planctomycetota bacterium]
MLFSKSNLMVKNAASKSKKDAQLNCVHFAQDGTTVASNGKTIMAVGPIDMDRTAFPENIKRVEADELGENGVSVPVDLVETAIRNLPRDKRVGIQNVAMTECNERMVEFTSIDTRKRQRVASRPVVETFPKWKEVFKEVKSKAKSGKICVSRKDLISLLTAIDQSCDDGSDAVFIEFGGMDDGILLRCLNSMSNQHVLGVVLPYDTDGKWIRGDLWEKGAILPSPKRLHCKG